MVSLALHHVHCTVKYTPSHSPFASPDQGKILPTYYINLILVANLLLGILSFFFFLSAPALVWY